MSELIQRILGHSSVEQRPPCSSGDLEELATRLSSSVPDGLSEFWRLSNGAAMTGSGADMLGVPEALELLKADDFGDWLLGAGLLPVLYDQESNYICAAFKSPLAPRFVYLLHDDSPRVLYRDVDGFWDGCFDLVSSDKYASIYFHEAHGDYGPDAERTEKDIEAARQLIQTGDEGDASLAIQLLDATCKEEWESLLNGDRFSRQDALYRLRAIGSDAAKDILRRDAMDFRSFSKDLCDALEKVGMAYERSDASVRIGGSWMDLNAFFGRRHIANAIPRLVDWFQDVQDGNPPTDRAGHYMED